MAIPIITQSITELTDAPQRSDGDALFASKADPFLIGMEGIPGEVNPWSTQVNAISTEINTVYNDILDINTSVSSLASNKGLWSNLSGSLSIPASVLHNNKNWQLISDIVDVTSVEPGTDDTVWFLLTESTVTQDIGNVTTDTTIDASNGNIAKVVIEGDITFTFSSDAVTGDYDILLLRMTNPGAYTITWTDVLWNNDSEPSWQEDGVDIAYFIRDDIGGLWRGLKLWSGLVTESA